MKKVITVLCIIFILVNFPIKDSSAEISSKPLPHSKEESYQDIIVTLLSSDIQKVIDDHYKGGASIALFSIDILQVTRIAGTFSFIVKLQVNPFIGAHNTIGIDDITFEISPLSKVTLKSYEHIKSFPVPKSY